MEMLKNTLSALEYYPFSFHLQMKRSLKIQFPKSLVLPNLRGETEHFKLFIVLKGKPSNAYHLIYLLFGPSALEQMNLL